MCNKYRPNQYNSYLKLLIDFLDLESNNACLSSQKRRILIVKGTLRSWRLGNSSYLSPGTKERYEGSRVRGKCRGRRPIKRGRKRSGEVGGRWSDWGEGKRREGKGKMQWRKGQGRTEKICYDKKGLWKLTKALFVRIVIKCSGCSPVRIAGALLS